MSYITEIAFTAILCGLLTVFAPKGKTYRYIKYTVALVFLFVLISPVIKTQRITTDAISDFIDIGNVSVESNEAIDVGKEENLELVSYEICKAISESAAEHFGVDADNFHIKLITDTDHNRSSFIKEIYVYPKSDAANIDKTVLKNYFKGIFSSSKEVSIKIE